MTTIQSGAGSNLFEHKIEALGMRPKWQTPNKSMGLPKFMNWHNKSIFCSWKKYSVLM